MVKDTSITKQRKFYTILWSGFRIILFFQYEHLEVLLIVMYIEYLLSREVHLGKSLTFYSIHVHVIIYFVKCI